MRTIFFTTIVFQLFSFYTYCQDSSISFINATKKDDLIILGRVLSHAEVDYSVTVLPKTIVVQVIEVLRGKVSTLQVTIKGADTSNRKDLAALLGYEVGEMYVFSLRNFELNGFGQHSLDFANNFVSGNITNEPDKKYKVKLNKLLSRLVESEKNKDRNPKKLEELKTDLHKHYELLIQTMSYDRFKSLLSEVSNF